MGPGHSPDSPCQSQLGSWCGKESWVPQAPCAVFCACVCLGASAQEGSPYHTGHGDLNGDMEQVLWKRACPSEVECPGKALPSP